MTLKKKVAIIILSLLILSIVLPLLICCFYGIPSADDFNNALGWKNYEGNHLLYILSYIQNIYKIWQGTYTGLFLCAIPIYYLYGLIGLRISMFLIVTLFIFSCFFLITSYIDYLNVPKESVLISVLLLGFLSLFYLIGRSDLEETFYWYTGIAVYTLPICLSLLCMGVYLRYEHTPKVYYLVIGIILGFLGAGGSLNISALLCSVLLLGILYNVIVLRKISRSIWIGVFALLGSILNVIAPGNFSRHDAFDSKIRPISSLINALIRVFKVFSTKTNFIVILGIAIILFLWAFYYLEDLSISFKYPVLVSIYGLLGIIITDFPVILGYGEAKFPSRVSFVENLSVIIYVIIVSLYWGGWLRQKWSKLSPIVLGILISVVSICILLCIYKNQNLTNFKMISHFLNGDYKTISSSELSIIDQLEYYPDKDVIVFVDRDPVNSWANIKRIEISEDPSYWVNYAISQYYDKDSVMLRYTTYP